MSNGVCEALGIPPEWALRCEDSAHVVHDKKVSTLKERLDKMRACNGFAGFENKMMQIGSCGRENHFGKCEVVQLADDAAMRSTAEIFSLRNNDFTFPGHCGSRGFGNILAQLLFMSLEGFFRAWNLPFSAEDKQLVYAPLGTPEADAHLDDVALGAKFAMVNHMFTNVLVLEAFQEVLPGTTRQLVYFINHNIARAGSDG